MLGKQPGFLCLYFLISLYYTTTYPWSLTMARVRYRNVQFLRRPSLLLFKCHSPCNIIRRMVIESPRCQRSPITIPHSNRLGKSYGTAPSNNPTPTQSRLVGETGRQYSIECVLQEKDHRPERVYLASCVIEHPSVPSPHRSACLYSSSNSTEMTDANLFLRSFPRRYFSRP